jgi:hypothetical protein
MKDQARVQQLMQQLLRIPLFAAALSIPVLALCQDPPAEASKPSTSEPVRVVFAPKVGLALERSWEDLHDIVSTSIRLAHGEEAAPVPGQLRLHSRHVLKVVDHFLELEAGRPTKLRRTFLESRRDSQMGFQDGANPNPPMKQSGPLGNGVAVVFEWSPEESTYGRHYDALEGEEEDLIALEEDLDLRALLPAEPVAVGASWNVDPIALRDLFAPGGGIPYDLPRKADPRLLRTLETGLASSLYYSFQGKHVGTFTVTLRGLRETEERHEAVLALAADFKVSSDQLDRVQSHRGPAERAAGMEFTEATLVLELKGTGELVWDLDGGYARSLSLHLDEAVQQRLVNLTTSEAEPVPSSQDMRMTGKLGIEMTARPTEPPAIPTAGD